MNTKKYISDKYDIPTNKLSDEYLKYYYINYPQLCCQYNLKPINSDIKPFEFDRAISILNNYYQNIKSNYYKELFEKTKIYGNILDNYPDTNITDRIIYEYLKFRSNIFILTCWPLINSNLLKLLLSELKKYGNIYYIKKINLSYNGAINLLYQLYSDTNRFYLIDKIKEKLEYIHWGSNNNFINILVFENLSNLKITGSQSELKTQIRDFLLNNLENKNIRGDDLIHINDHYYQTIEYSKIYFHKKSLVFLNKQNLGNYLEYNQENSMSRFYFNTMKNWIINNIDLIDQERFLCWGSTVLYAYGIRPCRDIDGIISGLPENNNFIEKTYHALSNNKTKLFFIKMDITHSKYWTSTKWDIKDSKLYKILGISDRNDLIFNPNFHFYFNGIKIISLKGEITKKFVRARYSDYGDLLATMDITGYKIKLPDLTNISKENLIKLITEYLKNRYKYEDNKIKKLLEPVYKL